MALSAEPAARSARLDRSACVLWAAFTLLVVVQKFTVPPSAQNVFTIYREAALRWLSGQDLYPPELLFNYFPQAALAFVPWTWLPFDIGGAVWRALNIFVFALGVWRLSGASAYAAPSRFLVASLLTVLLSLSAARYGQITLTMAGLMMLAVAAAQRGSAWQAAVLAALAVAAKPPAIALLLVLAAVFPRIRWRCAAVLAALAVLPFAFQDIDYVLRQYAALPSMFENRVVARDAWIFHGIVELLRTFGLVTTDSQQMLLRGSAAIAVLALCWRAARQPPRLGVGASIYALVACYMLLFGYGTERNTYAMMGPVLGLLAVHAWQTQDHVARGSVVVLALAGMLSYTLAEAFPGTPLAMLKVVVCALLFAWVASMVVTSARLGEASVPRWQRRWRASL